MCGPTTTDVLPPGVPTKDGDLQSFNIVKFHKDAEGHASTDEKEEFLKQLLSTGGGRAWVADKISASLVPAVFGFAKEIKDVQATAACMLVSMKVNVMANGQAGVSTGHTWLGGLFSGGGGVYWGTLWFDKSEDINNADSVHVAGVGPSLTVTFFRPNGHAVGVYQGGGVTTCVGTGGGKWTLGG